MAVASFNYGAWSARYPEFSGVSQTMAQGYFDEATLYTDNTDASPVTDVGQRLMLLGMLTAHIAAMNGENASPLIGRVSSASEGSVSVATSFIDARSQLEAWASQTKYGLAWWAATSRFRKFRVILGPGALRSFEPYGRGTRMWR